MVPLKRELLGPEALLVDAVRAIEASRRRIAVVVDGQMSLLGTLTDGDVRRCLLAGGSLQTPVRKAMNASPLTAAAGSPPGYVVDIMRRGNVLAIPIVDGQGRFVELIHLTDLTQSPEPIPGESGFEFAVIMAGGEGSRLRPLTQSIPKPMVAVAGVPLLERQIRRLAEARLRRIYVAVNYLSHIIEEYLGDGSRFGVEVRYLRESDKLGTGGALSLLPERPSSAIIVMNGDILTTSDFASLYAFHAAQSASVTVAAIDYRINIPYGVLCTQGAYVTSLVEKPSQRFLCNAGMYAISPAALALVPTGRVYNMTELIEACLARQQPVAVFPLHEYWSDIGTPDDLERARSFFEMGTDI